MFSDVELQKKYRSAFRTLDERNRRLLAAADSVLLGYGKFHGEWNYTITPGVNKL